MGTTGKGDSQQRYPLLASTPDGRTSVLAYSDFHYGPGYPAKMNDWNVVANTTWRGRSGSWSALKSLSVSGKRTDPMALSLSADGSRALVALASSGAYGVSIRRGKSWGRLHRFASGAEWFEAAMAADGKSALAAWSLQSDGRPVVMASRWGGKRWSDSVLVATGEPGHEIALGSLSLSGNGSRALLAYVTGEHAADNAGTVDRLVTVGWSGGSWTAPSVLAEEADILVPDVGLSANGEHAQALWTIASDTVSIHAARGDGAQKWDPPVTLAENLGEMTGNARLSGVSNSGSGFGVWFDATHRFAVKAARFTSTGWQSPVRLGGMSYDLGGPTLATSANGKRAIAAWPGGTKSRLNIRTWKGGKWSRALSLGRGWGAQPQATIADDGSAVVAWASLNCQVFNRPQSYCSNSMKVLTAVSR
jgi:hypothetical protein